MSGDEFNSGNEEVDGQKGRVSGEGGQRFRGPIFVALSVPPPSEREGRATDPLSLAQVPGGPSFALFAKGGPTTTPDRAGQDKTNRESVHRSHLGMPTLCKKRKGWATQDPRIYASDNGCAHPPLHKKG